MKNILLFSALLLGCASPSRSSQTFLKHLKSGNYEEASKLTKSGLIHPHPKEETKADPTAKKAVAFLLSRMEYKITSTDSNGEKASVRARVQNVKVGEILAVVAMETMRKGIHTLGTGGDTNYEKEVLVSIVEKIQDPNADIVSTTITLELEKIEGEWKISNQKKLIRALLGM